MTADTFGCGVGTHDHDGGIPANVGPNTPLKMLVTRKPRFVFGRNRVDVRCGNCGWKAHLGFTSAFEQTRQQVSGAILALHVDDCIKRVKPLLSFLRVSVGQLMYRTIKQHVAILARLRLRLDDADIAHRLHRRRVLG